MSRVRNIKKKERNVKQTAIIYGVGSLIVLYIGCLLGASYLPNCTLNEFINNFNEFVIKGHHFIVGFNKYTAIFCLVLWVAFSLAFIIIIKIGFSDFTKHIMSENGFITKILSFFYCWMFIISTINFINITFIFPSIITSTN